MNKKNFFDEFIPKPFEEKKALIDEQLDKGGGWLEKYLTSKNLDYSITRKLVSKNFVLKGAAIGTIVIIVLLNGILEFATKSLIFLSGGDRPSLLGFINPLYMIQFFPVYLIVVIFFIIIYAKTVMNMRTAFYDIEDGQKGTARFATREEIHQQYRYIPIKDEFYENKGGIPIARGFINEKNGKTVDYKEDEHTEENMKSLGIQEVMYIDDSAVNNLIIGTTRSGKGETFVVPTIDIYSRASDKASMIINDPKGELIAMSKETLETRGYDVYLLNLTDPMNSMSYNPLSLIIEAYKAGEMGEAQLLCQTLTFSLFNDPNAKDAFWQNTAMSLTNAIILALCEEYLPKDRPDKHQEDKITLYAVANMLSELGGVEVLQDGKEVYPIDEYFNSLPITSVARLQYATTQFAKSTTKGSILVSAMNKLSMFTFDKTAKMTSRNSLNLKDIGFGEGKPKAIFMVTPDYDKSIHVLASIFVRQVYYVLAKQSTMSLSGKCDKEVVFILDEFGNMPPIEGMANIITVCLGRNIRFNLIIQAYNQLKTLYGDDAPTIEGNCGNQIYILTNDDETSEKFSKLIGEKTIVSQSRSGEMYSLNKNHSENLDARRLLKSDELRKLKEGEMVVVRAIKRSDADRKNKIVPNPIFNSGKYSMKYRYQYLNDTFNNEKSFLSIIVKTEHEKIKIEELSANMKNVLARRKKENANKEAEKAEENLKKQTEEISSKKQKQRLDETEKSELISHLNDAMENDGNSLSKDTEDMINSCECVREILDIDDEDAMPYINSFLVEKNFIEAENEELEKSNESVEDTTDYTDIVSDDIDIIKLKETLYGVFLAGSNRIIFDKAKSISDLREIKDNNFQSKLDEYLDKIETSN